MIIFNEKEYAEYLLKNGVPSTLPFKDLSIIAKYYSYKGLSLSEIKSKIVKICTKYGTNFNPVINRDYVNRIVGSCKKYNLKIPNPITITESEMIAIESLDDLDLERFVFAMLVIAKDSKVNDTRKSKKEHSERYFVNSSIKDILDLAGVTVTRRKKTQFLHSLKSSGLVDFNRYGSFELLFVDKSSDVAVVVSDFREIGLLYEKHVGIDIVSCEVCGRLVRKNKKATTLKHCKECSYEKQLSLSRQYKEKIRNG